MDQLETRRHPCSPPSSGDTAPFSKFLARSGSSGEDDDRLIMRAVERAKHGDRSAVHYIYVRYADDVYTYIKSIVRDPHDAEDIAQGVFAKLITGIGKYERRSSPFVAWLLRVSRNAALDHIRARRVLPFPEIQADDGGGEQASHERAIAVRQALEQLPEEQREVLLLRQVAGLSPGQIADLLGKTEGSIHGLHHRGRRALRQALTELGMAPVVLSA
jgi:RNA polymerase sigma-70 factor (ECF subfamily)